jgi:hypothetical protein
VLHKGVEIVGGHGASEVEALAVVAAERSPIVVQTVATVGGSGATGATLCQHCQMPPLYVFTVFKETGPQDFGGFERAEAQETAASDAVGVGEKWAVVKAPGQVGAGEILEEGQGPRQ